jgi:hypothetical protein
MQRIVFAREHETLDIVRAQRSMRSVPGSAPAE